MKKNVLLVFFSFFLSIIYAQSDAKDSVDYIYIGIEEENVPNVQSVCPPILQPEKVNISWGQDNAEDVLYRNIHVLRLLLEEKSNKPLKYASYSANLFGDSIQIEKKQAKGLSNALIEGIKCGKIVSICPDSLEYRYTYQRLIADIAHIEEDVTLDTTETYFPFQEFGIEDTFAAHKMAKISPIDWSALGNMMDIIIEKGFSTHNSRPYFRVLYFRLVWYNPEISPRPKILALIPYHFASPYLAKMYVMPQNKELTPISVLDYFASEQFSGYMISMK